MSADRAPDVTVRLTWAETDALLECLRRVTVDVRVPGDPELALHAIRVLVIVRQARVEALDMPEVRP